MDRTLSRWTAIGLGIALLGIPLVTFALRLLLGAPTSVGAILLREAAIFGLLGALLFVIRRGEKLPLSSIGLRPERVRYNVLWGLLAFALLAVGTAVALGMLSLFGLHYGSGDRVAFVAPLSATTLIVLRAGIIEEVFYRGYAIERIQALTGNRAVAALLPLAAFALFHYRQGLAGILVAAILGAVLTGFYLWRRNLAANITGHFLIDFIPNVLLPALGA